jgi:hypothetical protein
MFFDISEEAFLESFDAGKDTALGVRIEGKIAQLQETISEDSGMFVLKTQVLILHYAMKTEIGRS